jgi:hypothetical protein
VLVGANVAIDPVLVGEKVITDDSVAVGTDVGTIVAVDVDGADDGVSVGDKVGSEDGAGVGDTVVGDAVVGGGVVGGSDILSTSNCFSSVLPLNSPPDATSSSFTLTE